MGYRFMGAAHTALHRIRTAVSAQEGQGTVEYVALILLVAGVLAGVVVAGKGMHGANIAQSIVGKLKDSIENVGGGK